MFYCTLWYLETFQELMCLHFITSGSDCSQGHSMLKSLTEPRKNHFHLTAPAQRPTVTGLSLSEDTSCLYIKKRLKRKLKPFNFYLFKDCIKSLRTNKTNLGYLKVSHASFSVFYSARCIKSSEVKPSSCNSAAGVLSQACFCSPSPADLYHSSLHMLT